MVVPKFGMRYLANTVAIIKGGDRQLKFIKIKKYNNKYFAVQNSGIYELDDQYEYRYFISTTSTIANPSHLLVCKK